MADVLDAAGKSAGTCDGDDFRVYVCVRLLDSSGDTVATGTAALKLQLERPPAPVSVEVAPGERALHVSWAAGTATTGATASSARYRVSATLDGATVSSATTSSTWLRLGGLANGTTYDVRVVAYSEAGNASDPSAQSAGTPLPVDDFYEVYRRDGGGGAKTLAEETGLQDLSVFAEVGWARIDDFGRKGSWDHSPRGVTLGGGLRVAF